MPVDPAWILRTMIELEPAAPYKESYGATAASIATASERYPLPGQNAEKTAAIVTAVMWFESRFQQDAAGDCDRTTKEGTCAPGSRPHSFCGMQINETNFRGYRTTRDEVMTSIDRCVEIGLRILADSFRVCAKAPLEERLRWYAGGGPVCTVGGDPTKKSRHRMALAVRVYATRIAFQTPPLPPG